MFKNYEKVLIKEIGVPGTIVDILRQKGRTHFIVESDIQEEANGNPGGIWPVFQCTEDEVEPIGS